LMRVRSKGGACGMAGLMRELSMKYTDPAHPILFGHGQIDLRQAHPLRLEMGSPAAIEGARLTGLV
jgi:hypothetical protein